MTQAIRQYIGVQYGIMKRRWKKDTPLGLTKFYSESHTVLVVMPDDLKSAEYALSVVKFLGKKYRGRNRIVVAAAQPADLVSKKSRAHIVRFSEKDVNYFSLPKKSFVNRFSKQKFDLVIDLNLGFVLFAAYLTGMINARFRVSFTKTYGDLFYNVQYRSNDEHNKEVTYNSLCDYLENF